jgi:hypothetical protein
VVDPLKGIAADRSLSMAGGKRAGHIVWRLLLVTEGWRVPDSDKVIRQAKLLKLIDGKASDVTSWIQGCRTQKLQWHRSNTPSAES